ncbi:MAG: hypothetical protein ABII12_07620 [Planctomycetota bacterium]
MANRLKPKRITLLLWCVAGIMLCGCDQAEMDRKHQENIKDWNKFWGLDDSQGSLFGHKAGDTEAWTVECNEYRGPARRDMADNMATAIKRVQGIAPSAVWVDHDKERSRVFYGKYELKYVHTKVDREAHAKGDVVIEMNETIKRDLKFIRSLAIGDQYPFFSARAIPEPLKDIGPAEWNLLDAKGFYTLNVGVTYNTPTLHNHKQAAVEWVKALRDDGYEAYYYYSPDGVRTSICVGTFGEDALIEWHETVDGVSVRRTKYSDAVEALRRQGEFMYNLENGHRTYRTAVNEETGKAARMPNKSFLVKIPREASTDDR